MLTSSRPLLLCLLGVLLASASSAQPADFTPQQRAVYENYRLTLKVKTNSGYVARPVGSTGQAYAVSSYSNERWWGQRGNQRVSEAEFYEFAGAPEYAAEVRRRRRGNLLSVGTGVGMFAGAVLLTQVADATFTDDGRPNLALTGVIVLGLGGAIIGFRGLQEFNETKTYASRAAEAANRYNAILIEEIRRAGPNAGAGGR